MCVCVRVWKRAAHACCSCDALAARRQHDQRSHLQHGSPKHARASRAHKAVCDGCCVCVCVCFACVCVCVFARARVCACVPLPLATHFSVFMLTLLASLPCVGTGAGTTRRKSIRIGLTRTLSTGTCWWWWWCKEIVATSIRRSLTRCCRVPNASDTHTRMLLGFVFVFCFCFFAAAVCDVLIRACSFDQRLSKLGL